MPTMVTAHALIERGLRSIGVLGKGVTMSGESAVDGLVILNDLVDSLATERLSVFTSTRTEYPLTASTASYTIGSGGDFNQARPVWLSEAGVIADDTATDPVETPIDVLNLQGWSRVSVKSQTGETVSAIYYDKNWAAGLGRIYVTPIPTGSDVSLVLYTPTALTEFADLTTEYSFPPGYRRMLRAALAIELAPEYGVSVSPEIVEVARLSKAYVKSVNIRHNILSVDGALLSGARAGSFDIYNG